MNKQVKKKPIKKQPEVVAPRVEISPKEVLDNRLKRVEIHKKIDEIKLTRQKDELEVEKRKLENEEIGKRGSGWRSPIGELLDIAQTWIIDNSKSVIGGEPVLISLWDDDEMAEIKSMILKKVRKL